MIIVTGGSGFIGSNIVAALQDQRGVTDIVVCDYMEEGDKWKNLSKRELRDIIHPSEIFDFMEAHAEEISMVFHMGAISSTTETDVDLITQTNLNLSNDLFDFCGQHDIRLVYASSAATYGDREEGFDDNEDITDMAKLRPMNAYGWSKCAFDRRVLREVEKAKNNPDVCLPPQWSGLKFFNVYGPNEYHKGEQMSVICKLFPTLKDGGVAKLFKSHRPDYTDGGQSRDFVYVKDCVNVMLWLYDNAHVSGIFNVGTGEARSFADLAKAVFAALEIPENIEFIEMPNILKDKYQYFTQANMNKLREAGYQKEFYSLEDGVKDYVQNYMNTEDKYA